MGKTVTIDVIGIDQIKKDLVSIAQTKRLRQAVGIATARVEGTAKNMCPKDTGALVNSIHMRVENLSSEVVGKVYTNKEYAPYVEFGTGIRGSSSNYPKAGELGLSYSSERMGQVAQPFMYPALKQNQPKINKLLEDALRNEI